MVIQNLNGERVIAAKDFFVGPANDIENTTVLRPGDILTSVRILPPGLTQSSTGRSCRPKRVGFLLVNVAAAFKTTDGQIEDSNCRRRRANHTAPLDRGRKCHPR